MAKSKSTRGVSKSPSETAAGSEGEAARHVEVAPATVAAAPEVKAEVLPAAPRSAKARGGRARSAAPKKASNLGKRPAALRADDGSREGGAARAERDEDEDEDDRAEEGDGEADDDDDDVIEVVGEVVGPDEDVGEAGEDGGFGEAEPLDDEPRRPAARARRATAEESEGEGGFALSRTDPLQAYLREVQRHPLLTPEEEKTLTTHYAKTGDVATAARLVTSNLRLVVKLAYEYRRAYRNVMDLIQEGNIGLMQAVKRYDPTRGVKLSSYAAWWIRAYILRFILNNWRLVKLGTTQAQRKLFFNLNKEKSRLTAMGIEPTSAEIAKSLAVDEKEVIAMDRRLSSGEASLDAPVGDGEGRPVSRLEMLPSQTTSPDAAFEALEIGRLVQDRLQQFRGTLTGKDIVIFDKRMAAEDPLTLQELGDEFGISRERVRQLEARLTGRLRVFLKDELGDAVG